MIYVLGGINHEITFDVDKIPKKGDTLIADDCRMGLGGKGARQAAAIATLSNRGDGDRPIVSLISKVGDDALGAGLIEELGEYGVNTEFVRKANRATGTSVAITTGKDMRTVTYSSADSALSKTDIDEALEKAGDKDTLLCQLEAPLYIVAYALRKARSLGMTTILNPSPAKMLPDDIYYCVDIIVANAEETRMLTGIDPIDQDSQTAALKKFHELGVPYAVITLGAKGIAMSDGTYITDRIPAVKTTIVNRGGAGDTFVGAFTLTYPHIGMYSFREACAFAAKAASVALSRAGAAESIPTAKDVYELYVKEIGVRN